MKNVVNKGFVWFGLVSAAVSAAGGDVALKDVSDGRTDATPVLQAVVDEVSRSGGGRLTVPKGEYVVSGLELKNGVELHLEEGVALLSATNLEAYAKAGMSSVVFARGATNVSITGKGTIDGRGRHFSRVVSRKPRLQLRGGWRVLTFERCVGVRVEDVTLRGGTTWTCFLKHSDGVTMRRVKLFGHANYCNDGIDIDSRNVLIEDCDIDAEDDAIVFKTHRPDFTVENVTVRRCRLSTNSSHIKFGTESLGPFRNVRVYDCTCACRTPSYTIAPHNAPGETPGVRTHAISGIEVSAVDGGSIEDVVISNIVMGAGINTPVFVRLGRRKESKLAGGTFLKDVLISDVRMTEPASSAVACSITGVPGLRPKNIVLRNLDLVFPGGGTTSMASNIPNERERSFPMPTMFHVALPAYGLYVRHADGVRLENVKLRLAPGAEDARPPLLVADADVRQDGRNVNTGRLSPFQEAIDEAAAKGGGVVTVPPGEWVTGSIELKSGVRLHIEKGAKLLGSTNVADYVVGPRHRALIFAEGARNVSLTGAGLVDGRGGSFPSDGPRWHLADFFSCTNVLIEGLALRCGGSWTVHPRRCDGVTIRGVTIWSHCNHCNDGIDIGSSNVLIEDCTIDADDDALVFKTQFPDMVVENVKVRNCRLSSSCNFIKFGTESHGVIRNVDIQGCICTPPSAQARFDWRVNTPGVTNYLVGLSGLAFESVDGGLLENVTVRDVTLTGAQTPVIVRLGRRNESKRGEPGAIRRILVENFKAVAESRIACAVTGVPGLRPNDITFRNLDLTQMGGGTRQDVFTPVPEKEAAYPENRMFGAMPLPAYGFYLRHADGVRFEDVKLRHAGAREERPAIFADDATFTTDAACSFAPSDGGMPTIFRPTPEELDKYRLDYIASLHSEYGFFVPAADCAKAPMLVMAGRRMKEPPEFAISGCRAHGWSLLIPDATDVKGVLAALEGLKGRYDASRVYLKCDYSRLAFELLAAAPHAWAALNVCDPVGAPEGMAASKAAVDIVVGGKNKRVGEALAAYNLLAKPEDRLAPEQIETVVKTGRAPKGMEWRGHDHDFKAPERPVLFRCESGNVRLTVCRQEHVGCWMPAVNWFMRNGNGK